jgi:hypothetical protein
MQFPCQKFFYEAPSARRGNLHFGTEIEYIKLCCILRKGTPIKQTRRNAMRQITRSQMLEDLSALIDRKTAALKGKKGYAKMGAKARLDVQIALYHRITEGDVPSVYEITGIYGAGARFAENETEKEHQ